MKSITRRDAVLGVAATPVALLTTAGLPAAPTLVIPRNPDAFLVALCQAFERTSAAQIEASSKWGELRRQAFDTLPPPPETLADIMTLGTPGTPNWCKFVRRHLLSMVAPVLRSLPGRDAEVTAHFDGLLTELADYGARCHAHMENPALVAARHRFETLDWRLRPLLEKIEDTPARTIDSTIAKLRTVLPPNGNPTIAYSVVADLEQIAAAAA